MEEARWAFCTNAIFLAKFWTNSQPHEAVPIVYQPCTGLCGELQVSLNPVNGLGPTLLPAAASPMSPKSMAPPAALLSREMSAPLYRLSTVNRKMLALAGTHPSLSLSQPQWLPEGSMTSALVLLTSFDPLYFPMSPAHSEQKTALEGTP